MKILYSRKKRLLFVIIIILIGAMIIYLNRAYAHIYNTIERANLQFSDNIGTYMITNSVNYNSASLVYVALGDSLTAGVGVDKYEDSFPYLLAEQFKTSQQSIVLRNRAILGEKTSTLIKDLLPLVIKDKPDLLTLLIGVNDIHGNISAKIFQKNYEEILNRLTTETSAKIYVINLPYIGDDSLLLPPYNYLLDERTKEFNQIIKNLSLKYSVAYVDLYTPTVSLFKKSGDIYSADSFHPSALGYKLWANIIYDSIHK